MNKSYTECQISLAIERISYWYHRQYIENLRGNSLNLPKPMYQAINSTFFDTQKISSKPLSITTEFIKF